jgi:hypothetical protein
MHIYKRKQVKTILGSMPKWIITGALKNGLTPGQIERSTKYMSMMIDKRGAGILNSIINNLPIELHLIDQGDDGRIRKVSFIGPGTHLDQRLEGYNEKEGTYTKILTPPINKLDRLAMDHDVWYGKYHDTEHRLIGDKVLLDGAIKIYRDPSTPIINKFNSGLVSLIMGYKLKRGAGFINFKRRFANDFNINGLSLAQIFDKLSNVSPMIANHLRKIF